MPDLPDETTEFAGPRPVYELAFVRRCHQLIAYGYAELRHAGLSIEEEPAITGELVRSMRLVQERKDAPPWMIHLVVADDPPINAPDRLGKRRRRVDIEFERPQRGRRPRFQCEAKRLFENNALAKYLGNDGLGRFLAGDYSRDEDAAGMLGYVQVRTAEAWSSDLRSALHEHRIEYEVASPEPLVPADLGAATMATWRSEHRRKAVGRPIAIYHSLLVFTR